LAIEFTDTPGTRAEPVNEPGQPLKGSELQDLEAARLPKEPRWRKASLRGPLLDSLTILVLPARCFPGRHGPNSIIARDAGSKNGPGADCGSPVQGES
jgi:hypothetical protein